MADKGKVKVGVNTLERKRAGQARRLNDYWKRQRLHNLLERFGNRKSHASAMAR